jgi:uncharacterized SAM-binding protein YcdF (DUF218 family)
MMRATHRGSVAGSFAIGAALLAAAWLGGFVWFANQASLQPAPPPVADGIVALTGGADRIATAILLLRDKRARLLLISGVGPGAALPPLFRGTGVDPAALQDRVTLGRDATDTLGNAAETAAWVRQNDLHSLIVVTAGYHMKRALTELGRALPDVALYAVPVVPPAMRGAKGFAALRLLAGEYTKWLASAVGLTRLLG